MANFEKPLHDFTDEELQTKINQWDPRFGALALYELQRRLQEKNTKEISTLIKETKILTKIVDKNAKTADIASQSANRLAKYAIYIALLTLIVQFIFSIHQESHCLTSSVSTDDPSFVYYYECYQTFDFGLFGKHSIKLKDFKRPMET